MRYNKKDICIGVIKIIAFLLIFLMLFHIVTDLFRTKSYYFSINPIYNLPKNSVDVLLFGSSHMNDAISPMDLWNDYGITSFNAAVAQQTIPASYFEMREILKVQKPKVIVVETYVLRLDALMAGGEGNLHWLVDNVPLSLGISETIQTLIQKDHNKTEYYLNLYSFHNRWKQLSRNDFKPSLGYNRGGQTETYNQHFAVDYPTIIPRNETQKPPDLSLEYLYKMIKLCREQEIPLVFMLAPYNADSDEQKKFNYVDIVAREENNSHINFLYHLDEIGFDFAKDMANSGHVNYFGAQKITSYLGEYLQNTYHLKDHRNDPKIANRWNKDYETFARELNNDMMKTARDPDEYFAYLQNQDYILAWNAYSETPLSQTSLSNYLETMGLDSSEIKGEERYCAVTRGNQPLYQNSPSKRLNDTYMVEDTFFSFGRGITGSSNTIGVHVGRKEYSVGKTGVNLVVYDPVSRTVVDKVNIDLSTGELRR